METDLIHRDELRCRAEAWAEDVFAGEPDNCKYNSLLYLIDDSEVVGVADVETEKLIAALHESDLCYEDEKYRLCIEAANALERLTAENAEKDAEIERLKEQIAADSQLKSGLDNANALCRTYKADRDRLQAELDEAVEDMNHIAREIEKCDWTLAKDGEKVGSLHLGRCAVCNHRYCDEEILDGCHFEWRGKESENER